jgi:hypothetical protein
MKTNQLFTILLVFAAVCHIEATQAAQFKGNRQTRQLSEFHGISVSTGIDLRLTQKNTQEVVVEADQDDIDKLITTVEGGILKIYMNEKSWLNLNWKDKQRIVYVSFKTLDKLDASAGSDVVSESPLKLDKLNLDASSGSDVKLELEANELSVESSSGSDIILKGKATVLEASASSGSDIDASELQAKKCNASTSSGSDIKIMVTDVLNASASSGGNIIYSGNPSKKDFNESSGGDIHPK